MKIGLDAYVFRFPITGIGNYTYQLSRNLISKYNNDFFNLFVEDLNFSLKEMHDLPQNASYVEVKRGYLTGMRLFDGVMRKLLRNYYHTGKANTLYFNLFPLLKNRLEYLTQDLDIWHAIDWYFYPSKKAKANIITMFDLTTLRFPQFHDDLCLQKEKIKKQELKKYDGIIAISESTKNDLVEYYDISPEKIETIYLGVDECYESDNYIRKDEISARIGIPKNARYILSVSTIEPRKNFIQVLKIFKKYQEKNPKDDLFLICTGMWGWKNDELNQFLQTFPDKSKVIFTGYLETEILPSLYFHSEVFVYLSLFEGFGLPILEAMKSRTPVICSNTSSMPEVLGDSGILVSPDSTDECVNALEMIVQNPNLANDFRKKAYERSSQFTWEKSAEQTYQFYKKFL